MSDIYNILAQSRPSTTGNTTAYTKVAGISTTVTGIVVCNTTNSNVTYSIFICQAGTTYTQATAIVYNYTLLANDSDFIELPFTLNTNTGTIGVQSSSSNAINFTIVGKVLHN